MQLEFDHIQYNTINTRTLLYLKLKAIKIDTIPFVLISIALHFTSLTSPPIFLLGFNTLSTLQLWINLNKAMHYLLNSDSTSDKCTDQIWLLDALQPRYEFPPAQAVSLMLLWCSPIPQGRHIPSSIQHLQWLQLPSQHQHTLIFPNDIQMPQHILSTRSLCRFYVTCLDRILHSFLPI